jgi:hypothetical protein
MSGSGTSKNYKIIVDSKHFGNMKGFSPAEVAKRAAGKILGLSNKINRFSLVETKNGKIRNYKVSKENLIRPYKKNGKMITFRIIVKKIGKHTGGVGPLPKEIYEKKEFTEEDRKEIKARMFIVNTNENDFDNYDPYNLKTTINNLSTDMNGSGLALSSYDPIHHFFKDYYSIGIDHSNLGWMEISVSTYKRREPYTVNYEFSGDEKNFLLTIYNLQNALDKKEIKENCTNYVNFLKKLYPESKIDISYSRNSNGSNSNGSNSNSNSNN